MVKRCLLTVLFITGVALPVFGAGFVDTYGFGTRALSLGGAFTAVADDYAAAYYNPAGLAQGTGNHLTLDYLYTSPQLKVQTLSGEDLVTRTSEGAVRTDPTEYRGGDGLNLQIPIIGIILDANDIFNIPVNVQLGMALSLPENNNVLYRLYSFPPDQPHFIRYGDNIDRAHAAISVGVECVKDLVYVGAGIQAMLYGDGYIWVDGLTVGSGDEYENVVGESKLSTRMHGYPLAGLLFTPLDKKLKIGFSFHEEQELEADPSPALVETDMGEVALAMVMGLNAYFTPREYSLGVAYAFNRFLLSAEINRQEWSAYAYSPQDRIYFSGDPGFKNTLNYRLGVEFKLNRDASVMIGYCHQPTPVPDQSHRITNYLDMDKDMFSLGGSYTLTLPWLLEKPLTIAGVVQYQMLDDYTVVKDEEDTGITWVNQESYTVEGSSYVGGLSARVSW